MTLTPPHAQRHATAPTSTLPSAELGSMFSDLSVDAAVSTRPWHIPCLGEFRGLGIGGLGCGGGLVLDYQIL